MHITSQQTHRHSTCDLFAINTIYLCKYWLKLNKRHLISICVEHIFQQKHSSQRIGCDRRSTADERLNRHTLCISLTATLYDRTDANVDTSVHWICKLCTKTHYWYPFTCNVIFKWMEFINEWPIKDLRLQCDRIVCSNYKLNEHNINVLTVVLMYRQSVPLIAMFCNVLSDVVF
jgi:hypothetical protein